ncbi:MAG: hypothetical protein ACYCWA_06715 [Thiobacillus sp.]
MRRWLALLGLVAVGALHAGDAPEPAAAMTALRYVDQDPGDPAYPTRILVTPDYLRMDTGEDGGDFVLLDRRQRQVTNVMRDSGVAMVFSAGEAPVRPPTWKSELRTAPAAPGTRRFSLVVDGVVCSEGIVAPRHAPDAARAMAELKAVLAATQYRVWKDSPAEMQHDCDLANEVWEADALFGLGLPLEAREFNGRTRRLESESKLPRAPELFRVPQGLTAIRAPS